MYVYIKSEDCLWTVGFYDPSGKWHPESDHASKAEAAERVNYLNGSAGMRALADENKRLREKLKALSIAHFV